MLPYGVDDLEPTVRFDASTDRVGCFVRDCPFELLRPKRGFPGEPCPKHNIYCHCDAKGRYGTYRYREAHRNLIVDADYFQRFISSNPHKFESHRLGFENSEDALTWNVFRSFQVTHSLGIFAARLTGIIRSIQPELYLWGLRVTEDECSPWDLLRRARDRFENQLPVKRPATEPDIALYLPGEYLILIEAKFTSPNGFYLQGARKRPLDLTFDELFDIYWADDLRILDRDHAQRQPRVFYQLWRNTVFAEWMAQQDSSTTRAYHVNLVREGFELESGHEFAKLIRPEYQDRFQQIHWGQLYQLATQDRTRFERLCRYFEQKTAQLHRAFSLPRS